jgi:hypothetical protein
MLTGCRPGDRFQPSPVARPRIAGARRSTPNWRPWFVSSSRCALIHRIRLRGATSRYRATRSRRDSPTRCANEGAATTRQGHGSVDPNGTTHALARTRHWRWYSYLPPYPIHPASRLPIIWQVRCDPRHNFGVCPMANRCIAPLDGQAAHRDEARRMPPIPPPTPPSRRNCHGPTH